jgi:hypothetical protein
MIISRLILVRFRRESCSFQTYRSIITNLWKDRCYVEGSLNRRSLRRGAVKSNQWLERWKNSRSGRCPFWVLTFTTPHQPSFTSLLSTFNHHVRLRLENVEHRANRCQGRILPPHNKQSRRPHLLSRIPHRPRSTEQQRPPYSRRYISRCPRHNKVSRTRRSTSTEFNIRTSFSSPRIGLGGPRIFAFSSILLPDANGHKVLADHGTRATEC